MPDIQFFDAATFFANKITEVEQTLIGKKAELEILLANRRNLDWTISSLALLDVEMQRSIQSELVSLKEVLSSTERSITAMESENDLLAKKLVALNAARNLLHVNETP